MNKVRKMTGGVVTMMVAGLSLASTVSATLVTGFNGDFSAGPTGYYGDGGRATGWNTTTTGYTDSYHAANMQLLWGGLWQNLGGTTGEPALNGFQYDISFWHVANDRNGVGHTMSLYAVDNTDNSTFGTAFNGNEILIAQAIQVAGTVPPGLSAGTWGQSLGSGVAALPAGTWYLAVQIANDDPGFWSQYDDATINAIAIPEPATLALLGLAGIFMLRHLRHRSSQCI